MHDPTPCIDLNHRESVYASLTESVRRLIDVTIRSQAGPAAVAAAKAKIDGAADELSVVLHPGPLGVQLMPDGQSVAWGNAVVGLRNPVAPPLVIHHEPDGVVWSEFVLGAPYEGPPGNVHGGVCALVLDHVLGATAHRPGRPARTPAPSPCVTGVRHRWDNHCARRRTSNAPTGPRCSRWATWRMRTASRWRPPRAFSSIPGKTWTERSRVPTSPKNRVARCAFGVPTERHVLVAALSTSRSCSPRRSRS